MSWDYYKSQGYQQVSPKTRLISNAGLTGVVVWTPTSSLRIVLNSLSIACMSTGGTIEFYFGGNNNAQKLATFVVAGSTTIYPEIEGWESTAIDAPLYVNLSNAPTNGWSVTAEGFELE